MITPCSTPGKVSINSYRDNNVFFLNKQPRESNGALLEIKQCKQDIEVLKAEVVKLDERVTRLEKSGLAIFMIVLGWIFLYSQRVQ